MALKPPPGKTNAKPKEAPAKQVKVISEGEVSDGLPTEDTDQVVSMTSLGWMFVAPPGFGKSELFALFPDYLMLACEGGHKFIKGRKLIIDEWDGKGEETDSDGNLHVSAMEAQRRLESSDRYQFIGIDTIDALIKKCIDWHVDKANQAHLSDLGDYGKGFDLGQNNPIRKFINTFFNTGRGLGIITHQEIKTNTFKKKGPESKKETSLPNGIYKILYPQMDIIIHGEYGGVREGQKHRDRIIKSEGDEDILAKNRGGILPPSWISPLDLEERREQMMSFFQKDPLARAKAVKKAHDEYLEFYGE
jgi:hypothetical protein